MARPDVLYAHLTARIRRHGCDARLLQMPLGMQ
jgi:hypothetical protein